MQAESGATAGGGRVAASKQDMDRVAASRLGSLANLAASGRTSEQRDAVVHAIRQYGIAGSRVRPTARH